MLQRSPCSGAAAAVTSPPLHSSTRAWGLSIIEPPLNPQEQPSPREAPLPWPTVVWRSLDLCLCNTNNNANANNTLRGASRNTTALGATSAAMPVSCLPPPPPLVVLEIRFDKSIILNTTSTPILRRLATEAPYAAIAANLEVLVVVGNDHDESTTALPVDDGATAAEHHILAAFGRLRTLSLRRGGLTSFQGLLLPPNTTTTTTTSSALTTLDVSQSQHLSSLDGVHGCPRLAVLIAARTAVASLLPLRSSSSGICLCDTLRKVDFTFCKHLESLEGLEDYHCLEEINVSYTSITSISSCVGTDEYSDTSRGSLLHACRHTLKRLDVSFCLQLTSLDGLQEHSQLEEVNASATAVVSIQCAFAASRATLRRLTLRGCVQLASLAGLEEHTQLQTLLVAHAPITSVLPLKQQPQQQKNDTTSNAIEEMHDNSRIAKEENNDTNNSISNNSHQTLSASLKRLHLQFCKRLTSLEGLEGFTQLEEVDLSGTPIDSSAQSLRADMSWPSGVQIVK